MWDLSQETHFIECFNIGKMFLPNKFQFLVGFWLVIGKPLILEIRVYMGFFVVMIIELYTIVVGLFECMKMIWNGHIVQRIKKTP
jgi:hypothetical protein